MANILTEIVATKRLEVVQRKQNLPIGELENAARAASAPRGFGTALRDKVARGGAAVIAECKKASPSKGLLRDPYEPQLIAASYERGGATCLSVLTDEHYFQGNDRDLVIAREHCALPVLRKDFMIDTYQITESRALGADCVLLIAACLSDSQLGELASAATALGMDILIEVHDRTELERALRLRTPLIGINNRDLTNFVTDIEITVGLLKDIPEDRLVVSESGIRLREDVDYLRNHDVHAFLVGEAFMRSQDPGERLAELFS
jgi:indole-3-glycerol phosphate synthase